MRVGCQLMSGCGPVVAVAATVARHPAMIPHHVGVEGGMTRGTLARYHGNEGGELSGIVSAAGRGARQGGNAGRGDGQ